MIRIYVANLGKYNEGYLVGEWITLPCSDEELQAMFDRIGINEEYEEYAIHDYECGFMEISEYSSISTLNDIATRLEDLSLCERDLIKSIMKIYNMSFDNALSCIEEGRVSTINLDSNIFNDEENIGYSYIDEVYGGIENLDRNTLESHFDYESFGRDLRFEGVDEEYEIEYNNDYELGENYIELLGDISCLGDTTLESYFDYESFGRDLLFDYTIDDDTNIALYVA